MAWLPTLLGLGPGDVVVHPEIAYPTYDVGARVAGATPVPAAGTLQTGPGRVALVWVNSPSNPTGQVLGVEHLRKVVEWARARGAVVASDECYAEPVVGRRAGAEHPRPAGLRRFARGAARGLLAVEAVEPRRVPGGVRGRRPRAGAPAARACASTWA
ncbi:hypothetical protein GCM10025868_12940 [Angustibacter aerolatus]|uniref:Aminotransferase class I/classII large domain-containing protein n=1 Tax=Angustibacter aerolatus TaxID=1162965 RepID=A0ABQ6JFX5_9ACTN|nr:aminotransferase class I/II-fold pyridoxal phosphate-dependent enzyme [Angustibacter aerolatus]GMA86044.1 hypothetical protein GCM10025868_12940 [Angustibacter aerolatus]